MLTQFLAEAVAFVVGSVAHILEDLIPAAVFDWVTVLGEELAFVLSFGPASAIGVIFAVYYAVDTAINAYVFAIQSYRLLPAKAT